MIQVFKIFHGIDMMEIANIFHSNIIRRMDTVLNTIEKFHGTPNGQILSSINQ